MDMYMATVLIWAPNFAPRGWAYCGGQLMAISQNTALFSLIGTIYGGDGRSTFALPDLRSRVPVGAGMGQAPGLTFYPLGTMSGSETVTLLTPEIPQHVHDGQGLEVVAYETPATGATPQNGQALASAVGSQGGRPVDVSIYAAPAGTPVQLSPTTVAGTTGAAGGSQSHENRQPFTGLSFIIALDGIFPPRS